MKFTVVRSLFARPVLALAALFSPVAAPALTLTDNLPLQTGYTVATCYSGGNLGAGVQLPPPDPNGMVVVVWNTSPAQLSLAPVDIPGLSYNWQFDHNELPAQSPLQGTPHIWKAGNMGEVFGTALDDSVPPNIFVAATMCYGMANWPAGNGPGTVYYISGSGATEGKVTALPQLPNAGSSSGPAASLGNLCWYRTRSGTPWLYVTNMGDGLIYRMNPATGAVTATFDHGTQALPVAAYPAVPDNTSLLYTQPTRRPWGIGVSAGRLYYSIFDSLDPPPPPLDPNAYGPQCEIWSVALDNAGNFLPATAVREFKVPPVSYFYPSFSSPLGRSSLPVSDIEFSLSGAMLLAERYHTGCISPSLLYPGFLMGAHSTRVLEYTGSTGAWVASPVNKFRVGGNNFIPNNSAGGVGPACDGSVWCTGDALAPFGATAGYGLQRIIGTGNALTPTPVTQSHLIDFDGVGNYYSKSLIGDVDTVTDPPRLIAKFISAVCPVTPGAPYTVTINVTNLLAVPLTQVAFGPCPLVFLPPGGQSLVPSPASVTVNIAPGANANISLSMTALPIGGMKCFSIQGNPGGGGTADPFACSPKLCVELPSCPCLNAQLTNPLCPVYEGQQHSATLTITNLWNIPAYFYQLGPCPNNQLPPGAVTLQPGPAGLQAFSPPLAPNTTSPPINVTFPGLPVQNVPTTVCFIVQMVPQFENQGPFCEAKVCITFPPCPPPLPCVSATFNNVHCPTAPPGNYTMNIIITNLGPVPAYSAVLSQCPAPAGIPAIPSPPNIALPPLLQNQSGTYPIQLGGVGTNGGLACFCLTLMDANGRPLCTTQVCVQLPACPCALFSVNNVACPQYEGQPYTAIVNVTNTGFNTLYWIGFTPCPPALLPPGALPGVGVGPAGIIPLPPLTPGNTTQIPVTFTGIPQAGGTVCFNIGVFGEQEAHPECEQKLCFVVPACPPPLPCMNAGATPAVCPNVQGGPFTTNVTITNLQPVPAYTAQLIPCLPGLQPGEVAATPAPGSIALPPLLQNQSATYPVALAGVTSGQLACFCVRLFDANGRLLCERPICLRMPPCPVLCAHVDPVEIACPQGGNGYTAFLQIFNQSASTFFFYQTVPVPVGLLPPGALTGQPAPAGLSPLSPSIAPNVTGGAPVTLPNNLPTTGATFCFIIKFYGQSDNLLCQQLVCLNLPACQCGTVVSHSVDCVQTPAGVKRQLTITVKNLTNVFGPAFNFDVATIAPGSGFVPAVITPSPNPIPPGGTGTLTTCYFGTKPPQCLQILLTNNARTRCCPLKLCPLWVECAQPEPLHPDHCDLAPQFTSENGAAALATAWIYNGSVTPKSYTWTVTPVSVPGCTGALPPVAFLPSSGTVTAGGYSSAGISFTISGASLAAGQCAGFQVCFQEISPAHVPPVCCVSKLKRSNNTDVCVDWNPAGRSIPVGAGLKTIIIKNPTAAVLPVSLLLIQSGGVQFSLTGEFLSGSSSSGAGGPAPDYDLMPIELTLAPHQAMPVTFMAKVIPEILPGTGPGPKWTELQLLKLCNVLPNNPTGGGIDDPHTIASTMVYVPPSQPVSPRVPLDRRDYRFVPFSADATWFALNTVPGEILHPQSTTDLRTFLPEAIVPFATVQGPDGSLAGTGFPLWSTIPYSSSSSGSGTPASSPPPRKFFRFFGDAGD